MDKRYNPKLIEQLLYEHWERQGFFKPNNYFSNSKNNYCIVIPPPNITGDLHMGHAFQYTIMDILIRYKRMQGKNTLWQVGTDHAGIATQILMERKLILEKGKTKHDFGRSVFIDMILQWKEKNNCKITEQMRRLGYSVDWSRERFTMDDGLSNAVKEVFVRLYKDNLIYRDKGLVNWDPKLRTAISDLEIEKKYSTGFIWYIRYILADTKQNNKGVDHLVIATTRPETILGDTGIAVNPKDPRYRDLIGKFVILPIVGRHIPIIGDENTNMNKGTGCVKITPAHDFYDYEVGKRHNLPMINIMTLDGNIRQEAEVFGKNIENKILYSKIPVIFHGKERFVARKIIISELDRLKLLVSTKKHDLIIPYGDRSGVIIEPMLTDQWYVRVIPLAKVALKAVEDNKIKFIPKEYKNIYFDWIKNIRDWCVSRQLWWGHRIPAWYDEHNKVFVGRNEKEVRKHYQLKNNVILRQDEDVLDTWFSSGLWMFSSLGWPKEDKVLRTFHPTDVVVSGFDIIFFWIARMIMLTMHIIKNEKGEAQIPFRTVYITGLIRDEDGQKMSKSKGNVIDPIDIIDGISLHDLLKKRTNNIIHQQLVKIIYKKTKKQYPYGIKPYGADALRLTLMAISSYSRNINWDIKYLDGYRNFCNKLWNASRFIIMNTEKKDCGFYNNDYKILSLPDRWILTLFNKTIQKINKTVNDYRFDLMVKILYEFIWYQFCDWYLEFVKIIIKNNYNETELRGTRHTMIVVLEGILRLSHPIIPFITEEIWQKIKNIIGIDKQTIMLQSFPNYDAKIEDLKALNDIEWIKQLIVTIRTVRVEKKITPNKLLQIMLRDATEEVICRVNKNLEYLLVLAKLESLVILPVGVKEPNAVVKLVDGAVILILINNMFNKNIELERLIREITCIEKEINNTFIKVNNVNFINNAPKDIVTKEYKKLKKYQELKTKLIRQKAFITNS